MAKLKLNFSKYKEAQDMIRLIEKVKEIPAEQAIDFSINQRNCSRIIDTGWASIALSLWGHDDPERKRLLLEDPCIVVELSDEKIELITKVKAKEGVNQEIAVSYFLLFTMESLGYHI